MSKNAKWRLFGAVLLLGTVGLPFVRDQLEERLGRAVVAELEGLGKGTYSVVHGRVRIALWDRAVSIENVELRVDTNAARALLEAGELPERLAQFRVERLYVRTQLLPLLLHNELEIRSVLLEKPELVIHEFPGSTQRIDVSFRLGMLYEAIADRLVAFGVRYLTVLDGSLRLEQMLVHSTQALSVNHVDLWIDDLHIDSTLMDTSQRYLPVGDVRLRVGPQRFQLADSIHELSFEELRFGLKGDTLSVDRLRLHPIVPDPVMRSLQDPVLEISLRTMRISGLDLNKVYSLGQLAVGRIDLDRPVVRVLMPHEPPFDARSGTSRHSPLSPFSTAELGEITIAEGELELRTANDAFLLFDGLDLHLEGIVLDPTSMEVRRVDRTNAHVEMSRSILGSIGSGVRIFTGPLRWSQLSDTLLIRSIDADRLDALVARGHVENGHLDTLLIRGLDMERVVRENVVNAKGMELRGFDLHLPDITTQRKRSKEQEANTPIPLEGSHFDELILAGRVTAIGSAGSSDVQGSIGRFDLHLFDIDMDSVKLLNRPLFASEASVSMWEVDLTLPKEEWVVHAAMIKADSRTGSFTCNDGRAVQSKGGIPSVRTAWDVIAMERLDVRALLEERIVSMDRLVVGGPEVITVSNKGRGIDIVPLGKWLDLRGLELRKVQINDLHARVDRNGAPLLEMQQGMIRARNYTLDREQLARQRYRGSADSLVYRLKGISASLGDGGHLLSIESLLVDANDPIAIIRKLDVHPSEGLAARKDRFWITVPEIISRGYDPLRGRTSGKLSLGKVLVHAPQVRAELFTKEGPGKSGEQRPLGMVLAALPVDLMSGLVDTIAMDNYVLQGGTFDLVMQGAKDLVEVQLPDVEIEIDDLLIASDTRFTRNRPLPARRVRGQFLGAQGQLNGKSFPIRADRIKLDLPGNGLDLFGVHVDLGAKEGAHVTGELDEVSLSEPALYELLGEEEFHVKRMLLRGGALDVFLPPQAPTDRSAPKKSGAQQGGQREPEFWDRLRRNIGEGPKERMRVDEFQVENIRLRLYQGATKNAPLLTVKEFGATVHGLRSDRERVFEKTGVDLDMKGLAWQQDDGRINSTLATLQADHRRRTLRMSGLTMTPKGDRLTYARSRGHRFDAIDLSVATIRLDRFDLDEHLETGLLSIGRVTATGLVFDDLRDHRLEHPTDAQRDLLGTMLRRSTTRMDIDTIMLADALMRYSEIHDHADRPGRISITNIDLLATNIRNVGPSDHGVLSITMDGRLQGTAPLHVEVEQEIDDPRDLFTYRLQLGAMDMTQLSGFIEPVLYLRLRSGHLDTLRLVGAGNNDVAIGQLEMYYTDLQITVLSKKAEDQTNLGSGLASLAANALVRKNRYERSWSDPTPLYFERWKDRGFPNYLVKLYLSGLPGAVGLGGGKQRKEVKRTDEEELKRMLEQVEGWK